MVVRFFAIVVVELIEHGTNMVSHLIDSPRTYIFQEKVSLIRPPIFRDSTTGFPAKSRLRKERRNSILMTCHYPDLGGNSESLN